MCTADEAGADQADFDDWFQRVPLPTRPSVQTTNWSMTKRYGKLGTSIRSRFVKNSRTRLFAQQVPLDAILLEADSSLTLHRQLYLQLKQLILDSTLKAGTAMPSSRLLARDLGVGRNTVIAAYEQLASEGYLETAERSRTAVADLALGRRTQQAAPAGRVCATSSRSEAS